MLPRKVCFSCIDLCCVAVTQDAHEFLGDLVNAIHDDLAPFAPDAVAAIAATAGAEAAKAESAALAGGLAATSSSSATSSSPPPAAASQSALLVAPTTYAERDACPWLPTNRSFHAEVMTTPGPL